MSSRFTFDKTTPEFRENEPSPELALAIECVRKGGELLLEYYDKPHEVDWTKEINPATEVDKMISNVLRTIITERFPHDNIWSEEQPPSEKGGARTWYLDEIDGTKPFMSKISPHFGVSLGLVENGIPIAGAVNFPLIDRSGRLYCGEQGKPSLCNGEPIQISNITDLKKVIMNIDSGKENIHAEEPYRHALKQEGITLPVNFGCASVCLCFAADGHMQASLATSLSPEDTAGAVAGAARRG
ncbi:MAG: inositol monophosphatase family protein [Patescibacteria group bacterium]